MDNDKKNWLKSIGVSEVPKGCQYYAEIGFQVMFYSEKYLEDTPLDVLKTAYRLNIDCFSKFYPSEEPGNETKITEICL